MTNKFDSMHCVCKETEPLDQTTFTHEGKPYGQADVSTGIECSCEAIAEEGYNMKYDIKEITLEKDDAAYKERIQKLMKIAEEEVKKYPPTIVDLSQSRRKT